MNSRFLIVGCGGIGYRHLEAAVSFGASEVWIVEKDLARLRGRIADSDLETRSSLTLHDSLTPILSGHPQFECIISGLTTTAQSDLFEDLLRLKGKYYLFEKPIAQSVRSLDSLWQLIQHGPGENAVFVNCSRDTWGGYECIRRRIASIRSESPHTFHFEVFGNLWGLGCNAVHFMELFRVFTGAKEIVPLSQQLTHSPFGNKRGPDFDEFVGTISFKNDLNDSLQLTSAYNDPAPRGLSMVVQDKASGQHLFFVDEEKDLLIDLQAPEKRSLQASYVSETTRSFLQDLLNPATGTTPGLPLFRDVMLAQRALLECLKSATGNEVSMIT